MPPVLPAEFPRPATHLYGKVLFEDDFDESIDKWTVVVFRNSSDDPGRSESVAVVEGGSEHLWAMNADFRSRKTETSGVSCVMIHPNVDDMIKQDMSFETLMPGLRSKEAITAERFVVEIRYCISRNRRGNTRIGTSGIQSTEGVELRQNPKAKLGTGWQLLRCEFRPAKGHPEDVLLRHFFHGRNGDRHFNSSLVSGSTRRVVFSVENGTIAVDRVTVREILEEPEGEEGAE